MIDDRARAPYYGGERVFGDVYFQAGTVGEEAIQALQRATYFNFRFVQAFASLGSAYLMKGMIDESIQNSMKALELAPEFAVAHNNLAIAYLEKGDYPKAVEHCDQAVKLGYTVAPEILKEIDKYRT